MENDKFVRCCSITAIFRYLTASLTVPPPSTTNVFKFENSCGQTTYHSALVHVVLIVVGLLWNSCRTIILLIDGKKSIKSKILSGKLLERSIEAICPTQFSHLCHTLARSYFECLTNDGCLVAEKGTIETNGSKSEMVMAWARDDSEAAIGPFQPFIVVLLLFVVAHLYAYRTSPINFDNLSYLLAIFANIFIVMLP